MKIQSIAVVAEGGCIVLPFTISDQVKVDNRDVAATIVGLAIYARGVQYQISWWVNGDLKEAWVDEERLVRA